MIGVALVSAAAVFASSLRATFSEILENSVKADFIITDESFQGLSPAVAETLAQQPELSAVTPVRGRRAADGDEKAVGAVDPLAFEQLADIDVTDGDFQALADGGIFVHKDPAEDLDLWLGDLVEMTFQNGTTETLPVAGIFEDAFARRELVDLHRHAGTGQPGGNTATSSSPASPTASPRRRATPPSPQRWSRSCRRWCRRTPSSAADQEGQIDQIPITITVLLMSAIVIAVLGISITLAPGVFERTRSA